MRVERERERERGGGGHRQTNRQTDKEDRQTRRQMDGRTEDRRDTDI